MPLNGSVGQGTSSTPLEPAGGGFVAGTLVHAKNGLVPIERACVGDWVLSQPQAQGERSHRRVVKTYRIEDQKVFSVLVYDFNDLDHPIGLLAAGAHPFWAKGKGWTRCDQLSGADLVELANGGEGAVISVRPVFRTAEPGVAWVPVPLAGSGREYWEQGGLTIDLNQGQTQPQDYLAKLAPFAGDFLALHEDRYALRVPLYDIEVEDDQGFFVGIKGVRVGNGD